MLLGLGFVTTAQLDAAAHSKGHAHLGEHLVSIGLLSRAQLASAIAEHERQRALRIGEILVLQGAISDAALREFLELV